MHASATKARSPPYTTEKNHDTDLRRRALSSEGRSRAMRPKVISLSATAMAVGTIDQASRSKGLSDGSLRAVRAQVIVLSTTATIAIMVKTPIPATSRADPTDHSSHNHFAHTTAMNRAVTLPV